MGFYTKYWSTLFKGPRATKLKLTFGVRRAEKFGGLLDHLYIKDWPKQIEKRHGVTQFLKRTGPKFIETFRKLCNRCFNILFNQLTQDLTELKAEDGVIKVMADYWNKTSKVSNLKDIERLMLEKIFKEDKKDEFYERDEYKEVEAIIIEAKKFIRDRETFMNWLRTRLKQRAQLRKLLEGIVWRRSVRLATREILLTKNSGSRLRTLLNRISNESKQSNFTGLSKELENELNQVCTEIKTYFQESYLARERAILMILKALYVAEAADDYLKRMVERHYLPAQSTQDLRNKLAGAVSEVGEKFHNVISQEFRILIHKFEVEESEALKLARAT